MDAAQAFQHSQRVRAAQAQLNSLVALRGFLDNKKILTPRLDEAVLEIEDAVRRWVDA